MPNFVQNKIKVFDIESFNRLIDGICVLNTATGKMKVDFEKVIKMPDEIRNVSWGSDCIKGLALFFAAINSSNPLICNRKKVTIKEYNKLKQAVIQHGYVGKKEIFEDDICLLLCKESNRKEKLLQIGERCISNLLKYNAYSWYDWSIDNWGTKWNAFDTFIEHSRKTISFFTAYCSPTPVVLKASQILGRNKVLYKYVPEEPRFSSECWVLENGHIIERGNHEQLLAEKGKYYQLYTGNAIEKQED